MTLLLLALAGAAGGAINSVAGGGTFLTFPLLILGGVPPVVANATNSLAMWIGGLGSVGGYRRELAQVRSLILPFSLVSAAGGLAGAALLLTTPEQTFVSLIPFLLLGATVLFAFGGRISAVLRRHAGEVPLPVILLFQFAVAVYGGYFGAGIGILMLAAFAILGIGTIHVQNGLKVVLGALINGVAAISFALAGAIAWPEAAALTVGALAGGFLGASIARRLNPTLVRGIVVAIGAGLTIVFFVAPPR